MKRILSIAAALLLCVSLLCVTVFAASANASLTGPGTVRAGDTITLTFKVSGSNILGVSGALSYDASQLELKGTTQKIGNGWAVEFNGNSFVAYDNNLTSPINGEASLFTVSFKVKSIATGAVINVYCTDVVASDGSAESGIGAVTYSATIAAPLSKDNSLKSLTVSNATISPAFDAGTTSYTAEVPYEVSKLQLDVKANDSKAKVSINNPELTVNGTTDVTITVTAENGSKKTYTITVKRAQDPNYVPSSNNDLSRIAVDGFVLSPGFTAENTQYVIWLPYETENVVVRGTAADRLAHVTVEGGQNLVAGADNEIKVICTAEDGTQKVYTVIAKRAPAHGESVEPTVPPTEPTEPDVEPGTEPAPSQPQEPAENEKCCGIPWWILLIVGILCLAGGIAAGIFVDKKYLKK